MKNITNNKVLASIVLSMALVFVVGLAGASTAHAQYDSSYYGYDSYNSYGNGYNGCDYGCGYDNNNYYPTPYPAPTNYPPYQLPPTPSPTSPLQVSCYPQPLTANVGDSATWVSNVYGGTGAYSYSWSGTDGLVGSGPSMSKVYYTSGSKSANLTVMSGNQTRVVSCSGTVVVYGNNNYYPPVYNPPVYVPPVYVPPVYIPPTYSPLQVSCVANTSYANVGTTVTWSATVYGGSGYSNGYGYSYTWSGTDNLYGNGQSISTTYNNPGYKTATVTVYGNGQNVTQTCSTSVNVTGYQTSYYTYSNPIVRMPIINNNSGLDIGCYADPANASINQPITWNVEVTGGAAPYTYSWTGSDGLTGMNKSVIKYYGSSGSKNAIVTVNSADGKTGTKACTNAIAIRGNSSSLAQAPAPAQTAPAPATQNSNGLSASALFSLSNVPWGWVAILIILVLFGTVLYLVFNRTKI